MERSTLTQVEKDVAVQEGTRVKIKITAAALMYNRDQHKF